MHSLHSRPSTQLELQIDNITLPMNINPKILGPTLGPKLTFYVKSLIEITITKSCKTIQIIKALTSRAWGKQKEAIIATYKAKTRPILEYMFSIPFKCTLYLLYTSRGVFIWIINYCHLKYGNMLLSPAPYKSWTWPSNLPSCSLT